MFKIFLTLVLLIPAVSHAGYATGKISGYVINEYGVYVSSEATTSDYSTDQNCNGLERFYFAHGSAFEKTFMSAILTAYTTGGTLSLYGTGVCSGGSADTLRKICAGTAPC